MSEIKEERKKLSPVEKHSARVFVMSIFALLLWAFLSIIVDFVINYIFKNLNFQSGYIPLLFMMFIFWKTNVRFGFVENLIEGKKKHKFFDTWFESVSGR